MVSVKRFRLRGSYRENADREAPMGEGKNQCNYFFMDKIRLFGGVTQPEADKRNEPRNPSTNNEGQKIQTGHVIYFLNLRFSENHPTREEIRHDYQRKSKYFQQRANRKI